jgi:hypothetical protein
MARKTFASSSLTPRTAPAGMFTTGALSPSAQALIKMAMANTVIFIG